MNRSHVIPFWRLSSGAVNNLNRVLVAKSITKGAKKEVIGWGFSLCLMLNWCSISLVSLFIRFLAAGVSELLFALNNVHCASVKGTRRFVEVSGWLY